MGKVEKHPYLNDDGVIIYLTPAEIKIRNEVKAQRVQAARAAARDEDEYRRQETRAEREAEEARARDREGKGASSRNPKSSGRKR